VKRKKIAFISAVLSAALLLGFTLMSGESAASSVLDTINSAVDKLLTGSVTGEVGKTYSTQWFRFSVSSIEKVKKYADYSPQEGNILVDVLIAEQCTFDRPIEMGSYDFFVDAESFEEYVYPLDPLDDTMMPKSFELAPNEKAEYHAVFEVPEDVTGLKLVYIEIDEKENEGATFTVEITD
jgi:hypothetical protein